MDSYIYSYLIGVLVLLLVWCILFFIRKDNREEFLTLSFIMGVVGTPTQLVYTIDWWRPSTITGTLIGIEDFLLGLTLGGIGSVIYEDVFKKKIKKHKKNNLLKNPNFYVSSFLPFIIFFGSFYLFNIHSLYSSIIALLFGIGYIIYRRKDLMFNSVISGFLVMIISIFSFLIVEVITPGWVLNQWLFDGLSGILILTAPIEDLIWFFLVGAYIGPLYEFWVEAKLERKN